MSDLSDFNESDFDKSVTEESTKNASKGKAAKGKEKDAGSKAGKNDDGDKASKPDKGGDNEKAKTTRKRSGSGTSDTPAMDQATGVLSPPEFFICKIVHDAQCFTPKVGHSVVEANGAIYIYGGQNEEESTSTLIRFNPSNNSFKLIDTTGDRPGPRRGATLNVWRPSSRAETSLLLFGGLDEEQKPTNETWALSLNGMSWKELSLKGTPDPRAAHAAVFSERHCALYVFGGQEAGGTVLRDAHVLKGASWSSISSASKSTAPSARCHHSASLCMVENKMAVAIFGGDLTGTGKGDNELWLYYIDNDEWEQVVDFAGEPPCARWKHATAFFDSRLWVIGGTYAGWFKNYVMSDFYVFDFLAKCWFKCDVDPKDLGYHTDVGSLTLLPASKAIFIFGGANQSGYPTADVYRLAPVCTTVSLTVLRQDMKKTVAEVKQVRSDMDGALQETRTLRGTVSSLGNLSNAMDKRLQEVAKTAEQAEKRLKELSSMIEELQGSMKKVEASLDHAEASIRSITTLEKKFGIMEVTIQEALAKLDQKADITSLRAVAAKMPSDSDDE
ncbi:hypothetical protein Efla_001264 [Eimeria flavescens]